MPSLQSLAPKDARLCLKMEKLCRSRLGITPGAKLLLALSGGPDSMALAVIFLTIAPRMRFELSCMHIDHHLRPASGLEADFVRDFCQRAGLPCVVGHADVGAIASAGKCGLEEAGRLARYKLLAQRRREINADFILTGHQAEDLAEDIILRLLRGAGWPALSGMSWRNGHVLRPLLHESPERLKDFLRDNGLRWVNDESNQSLAFRRNRIRHLLMPMLRCENPAVSQSLQRIHDFGQIDAEYWRNLLDKALDITPWREDLQAGALILPEELLASLETAARLRLYHRALLRMRENTPQTGSFGQNRADALFRLDAIYKAGIGGKTIQCSGGITATLQHGGIALRKNRNPGVS